MKTEIIYPENTSNRLATNSEGKLFGLTDCEVRSESSLDKVNVVIVETQFQKVNK